MGGDTLMNSLIALIRRIEHFLVGSPDKAMKPLTKVLKALKAVEARAVIAETAARAAAFEAMDHAGNMSTKVYAARAKTEKLEKLLG